MKKLFLLIFSLGLIFMISSCSKEDQMEGRNATSKFEMNIIATAPQIADTKAELHNVIVYSFNNGDAISVINVSKGVYLGNLTAQVENPDAGIVQKMMTTKFSGMLEGNVSKGDKLAFIYPATTAVAGMSFSGYSVDLSSQAYNDSKTPFTAYCQLESTFESSESIDDLFISFTNVTSYLVLNIKGLTKHETIDNVTLNNVNNGVEWSIKNGEITATPTGDNAGTIIMDCAGKNIEASSRGARSFYFAVPECNSVETRTAKVIMGSESLESQFSNVKLDAGKFYSQNMIVHLPYVEISAKYDGKNLSTLKWYRQNLGVSSCQGCSKYNSTLVPGTADYVVKGDYFYWATYENFTEPYQNDKGLLIYMEWSSWFKVRFHWFSYEYCPYTTGIKNYYTKYTEEDGKKKLDLTDDVAHIVLGGTWHIPTTAEYKALKQATYWQYDESDKGYYVYLPDPASDAGVVSSGSGSYEKANALLFFPLVGYIEDIGAIEGGRGAYYMSSNVDSQAPFQASVLQLTNGNMVNPDFSCPRTYGYPVRPVSE